MISRNLQWKLTTIVLWLSTFGLLVTGAWAYLDGYRLYGSIMTLIGTLLLGTLAL